MNNNNNKKNHNNKDQQKNNKNNNNKINNNSSKLFRGGARGVFRHIENHIQTYTNILKTYANI